MENARTKNAKELARIGIVALVYTIVILIAELTLGNPDALPDHWLWSFTNCNQFIWSFSVHLVGFLFLLGFSKLARDQENRFRTFFISSLPALIFFAVMEEFNIDVFHYFVYNGRNALILIILMYAGLCAGMSILLLVKKEGDQWCYGKCNISQVE